MFELNFLTSHAPAIPTTTAEPITPYMKTLKPEHFLYAKPGDHFCFNEYNAKDDTYKRYLIL